MLSLTIYTQKDKETLVGTVGKKNTPSKKEKLTVKEEINSNISFD